MKILATFFFIIFSLNNVLAETPEKIIQEIVDIISDVPASTKNGDTDL